MDRYYNLTTLNIQTAGGGSSNSPEEKLKGLERDYAEELKLLIEKKLSQIQPPGSRGVTQNDDVLDMEEGKYRRKCMRDS